MSNVTRLLDKFTLAVEALVTGERPQATQYDDPTMLRCRRRPRRKPCRTLLTIFFDSNTNDVLWLCPRCHDEGRIAGWEDTFWDNGELAPENPS